MDAPPGLEPEALAGFVDEVELRDVHLAGHDPLDAPDTGVIVERRPLPGTPGHHDGGIAEIVVAVQQAAARSRPSARDETVRVVGWCARGWHPPAPA